MECFRGIKKETEMRATRTNRTEEEIEEMRKRIKASWSPGRRIARHRIAKQRMAKLAARLSIFAS